MPTPHINCGSIGGRKSVHLTASLLSGLGPVLTESVRKTVEGQGFEITDDPEKANYTITPNWPDQFIVAPKEYVPPLSDSARNTLGTCIGSGLNGASRRITAVRRLWSPDIPRNDAGHLAAAEAKRQRKAAKKERDLAHQTPTT